MANDKQLRWRERYRHVFNRSTQDVARRTLRAVGTSNNVLRAPRFGEEHRGPMNRGGAGIRVSRGPDYFLDAIAADGCRPVILILEF